MQTRGLYRFNGFELDVEGKALYFDGELVPLKPKALDTLVVLVLNAGQVVEKDRIISEVWPDTFVEENSLSRNIHEIRKALSSAVNGQYIETVPTRGYRFVAGVETPEGTENAASEIPQDRPVGETAAFRWHFVAIILLGVLMLTSFAAWWGFSERAGLSSVPRNKRNIRSLAILPLKPISTEQESAVVSLGVTDELIGKIGGLNEFVVRPLSAVAKFQFSDKSAIDIGRELQVDAVLVGSLQREGQRIRINLRLWDVRDGAQLWSRSIDHTESDIFTLQKDLALEVANSLLSDLSADETAGLSKSFTSNKDAYRLYLRGRHAWNKRTKESLLESVSLFRQAIEEDPAFAGAYAALADSYAIFNDYGVAPPDESFPKAKAAARKALEIDPEMAEARAPLAYTLATYEWDYENAEAEYKKLIEARPNYATGHQWYGEMLVTLGRFKEAEERLVTAKEIDPLVPIIRSELAVLKYYDRRFEESIKDLVALRKEFPEFPTTFVFLSRNFEQLERYDEAIEEELKYWEKQGLSGDRIDYLRRTYREEGRESYLRDLVSGFVNERTGEYFYEYRLVHIYGRLKDRGNTLRWLEKGVETRSSNIYKVFVDPVFDFLRGDPEFRSLIRKMNLPEE